MKKILIILYIVISNVVFGQFKENIFDNENSQTQPYSEIAAPEYQTNMMNGGDIMEESEPDIQRIGNPGEDPVPIDQYTPLLVGVGIGLMLLYRRRIMRYINS